MFETVDEAIPVVRALVSALAGLDVDGADAARIDLLRAMEEAKAALAAAQARVTVAFAASQRAEQLDAEVPAERADRGIAAQVALALRTSPWHAQRFVGWSRILTTELPMTFAALRAGATTERRAMTLARETIWLSRADRATVDAELGPRMERLGDRRVEAEAKRIGARLDPAGYTARCRAAETDRHVTLRPAPDCMTRLTALLPVAQGVAAYAALCREADTTLSGGDARGRGQVMADTLVQRVTGQSAPGDIPLEIGLVMTDGALLGEISDEPALVDGVEVVPAQLARELIADARDEIPMWIRRLYVHPRSGELVAMESSRRAFTPAQRRFLRLRDRYCRTPWCGAPIRHADHVVAVDVGGATRVENGQGLCEACNHAKQAPGWGARLPARDGPHEVETVTPTGHRYRSEAPDPPRAA